MKPSRRTNLTILRSTCVLLAVGGAVAVASCSDGHADEVEDTIVAPAFANAVLWDDGQAEVAFYEVERSTDQYGRPNQQRFMVGTYLVKHDFDPVAMSKAVEGSPDGVPAFKYALFYELESGSYQYKRSYVVNAARTDLRPLKQSFTSFDWCSNQYREMAFEPRGKVQWMLRSDDYGNDEGNFRYVANAYPVAEVPVLVRGMDFSGQLPISFQVVTEAGTYTRATAELTGRDTLETEAGRFPAEKIAVRYAAPVPSPIAEQTTLVEHYWRATGPARLLLGLEGEEGSYSMRLVEHLRSPYWQEDIFLELARVRERP